MKRSLMMFAAVAAFVVPAVTPMAVLAQDRAETRQDGPRRERSGDRASRGTEIRRIESAPARQQMERPQRGPRPERPDRPNASTRPDQTNRPQRPDGERPNRPEAGRPDGNRPDAGHPDRPNRPDYNRPQRPDHNRPNRPDAGRPDWNNRPNRPDSGRPDRPNRPDWNRPDRPNRPDHNRPDWNRPNRPDAGRPDRPNHSTRPDHRPNRPNWNGGRDYRDFYNRWNRDQWRRDWDRRHHSDWWRHDHRFRGWSGVRLGFYFAPGYGYYSVPRSYWNRQWYEGQYLPDVFWRYQVNDWRTYGLGYPPPGTRWVYVDNSIYLIDDYDGYIIEVIRDAWRW